MFRLIKQVCIALLSFSGVLETKCISLNNQPIMTRPTLIDLNLDEHDQGLCHYPFMLSLDRYKGSCNAPDHLSSRICVPNKTEDLNLNVLNMTTRISQLKTLMKHTLCNCRFKSNSRKCNTN